MMLAILVMPVPGMNKITGDVHDAGFALSENQSTLSINDCVLSNPRADFTIHGGHVDSHGAQGGGMTPLMIQFTDQSTGAKGWSWDFGDGSVGSTDRDPGHTYTTGSPEGISYDVTLTVTGSCPKETNTTRKSSLITVYDNVGFLFLTSNPGGATVTIDGIKYPGVTQTKTFDPIPLAPGNHTVLMTLDGYEDYYTTITIVNRTFAQILPALERNATGSVSLPSVTVRFRNSTTTDDIEVTAGGRLPGYSTISPTVVTSGSGYKPIVPYTGRELPGFTAPLSCIALAFVVLVFLEKYTKIR